MRFPKTTVFGLFIATTKGAFVLHTADRSSWKLEGPLFLGSKIHDFQLDPRDPKRFLLTSTGGHLGPTVMSSADQGKTWNEAKLPPRFEKPKGKNKKNFPSFEKRTVNHNFWLTPGHTDEENVWYLGTSPQGLFRSEDNGDSWKGVLGFNEHELWEKWTHFGEDGTPDGSKMHSIRIDPRDPKKMYLSMSGGGTFESEDQGKSWSPLNAGVEANFIPGPTPEYGQDPHCMIIHPANSDILYQQNHCGIYRLDRSQGKEWTRIGKNMPKSIGDIGFPIVGHPTDEKVVWVFPMDGTQVWPRVSPQGKPAVYRTENGGKTWKRFDQGLPQEQAWFTVKRQAMVSDLEKKSPGLYFGTTSGELWGSVDGGESWKCLVSHLPHIYAVSAGWF